MCEELGIRSGSAWPLGGGMWAVVVMVVWRVMVMVLMVVLMMVMRVVVSSFQC